METQEIPKRQRTDPGNYLIVVAALAHLVPKPPEYLKDLPEREFFMSLGILLGRVALMQNLRPIDVQATADLFLGMSSTETIIHYIWGY